MSTNPTSFRFPFKLPPDIHPQVDLALRNTYNGILDLNQAIAALNTKVNSNTSGVSAVTQAVAAVQSAGGSPSFPVFGKVNLQPNLTPGAYTLVQTDLAGLILVNSSVAFALTLNSGLMTPFFTTVYNFGSGTITATPSAQLVNNVASVSLTSGQWAIFYFDGTNWWELLNAAGGGGSGTVTSVALTVPAEFSVGGSPVTTAGTLAINKATEAANTVWAGPTTGAAAQPTFRALVAADIPGGGAGALVLLEEHTASNSVELDFTTSITGTYDTYKIELINLIPATNATVPILQMSTNGGSSYDTGSNYAYGLHYTGVTAGFDGTAQNSSATGINLWLGGSNGVPNSGNTGVSGTFELYNPANASNFKYISGQVNSLNSNDSAYYGAVVYGIYKITTAVNAFRVLMASGNITSGTIRCYGIAK